MVSKRLVEAIENNAPKLAADLVDAVRQDKRAEAYANLTDSQFRGVVHDLYSNLGDWLQSRAWHKLQMVYERKGVERFHDGIPLHQIVFSLTRTKTVVLDFVRGSIPGEADERDLELNLVLSVSDFFDRAIYHTVKGYEHARCASGGAAAGCDEAAQGRASAFALATAAAEHVSPSSEEEIAEVSRAGTIGECSG